MSLPLVGTSVLGAMHAIAYAENT